MLTLQTRNNIGCTISRCILMKQRLQQRPFQEESILFLDDVPVRVIARIDLSIAEKTNVPGFLCGIEDPA